MSDDVFHWLEDANKPRTKQWTVRQNKQARAYLDNLPARQSLVRRLRQLTRHDDYSVPIEVCGRYFFRRRKLGQELSVIYMQDGLRGKPQALLDENTLSRNHTAIIADWSVSPNGQILVYEVSHASNDRSEIRVFDIATKRHRRTDFIPHHNYPYVLDWAPDSSGFWYSRSPFSVKQGEERYHRKVFFHSLGSDFKKDPLIFGKHLARADGVSALHFSAHGGRYVIFSVYPHAAKDQRNELFLYDTHALAKKPVPIVQNRPGLYGAEIHRGYIYITTNNRAPNWKVVRVPLEQVARGRGARGRTIIPEGKFPIASFVLRDRIFIEETRNAYSLLHTYTLDGDYVGEVPLPVFGSTGGWRAEHEESEELFFFFSSFTQPHTIYRYTMSDGALSVFAREHVPFDYSSLVTRQVWIAGKDKAQFPIFLVHKKGVRRDGNNPLMMYGYGGFGLNSNPVFSEFSVPFLEHGGIYVVANIRGGGEFGERWHKAGMLKNKQTVFDDFISAAEWLVKHKYTKPARLGIFGWSNGGLLTSAVMTQRPELFGAVIIGAPVADMLRFPYMKDAGQYWVQEYGDPRDKKMAKYLLAYSPYHNAQDGIHYPPTLILTADADDRVDPAHARKLAARLQEASASCNPILLRVEKKAGHGGAYARGSSLAMFADVWAFVLHHLLP